MGNLASIIICGAAAAGSLGGIDFEQCRRRTDNDLCDPRQRHVTVITEGETTSSTLVFTCEGEGGIYLYEGDNCELSQDSSNTMSCNNIGDMTVKACCDGRDSTMLVFAQQLVDAKWTVNMYASNDADSRALTGECVADGGGEGSLPTECILGWNEAGSARFEF